MRTPPCDTHIYTHSRTRERQKGVCWAGLCVCGSKGLASHGSTQKQTLAFETKEASSMQRLMLQLPAACWRARQWRRDTFNKIQADTESILRAAGGLLGQQFANEIVKVRGTRGARRFLCPVSAHKSSKRDEGCSILFMRCAITTGLCN